MHRSLGTALLETSDSLTFRMLVAKSGCSHVTHLDAPTTAAVQKYVTVRRVKTRRCDDLRELLHALGFHIQYVWNRNQPGRSVHSGKRLASERADAFAIAPNKY